VGFVTRATGTQSPYNIDKWPNKWPNLNNAVRPVACQRCTIVAIVVLPSISSARTMFRPRFAVRYLPVLALPNHVYRTLREESDEHNQFRTRGDLACSQKIPRQFAA